MTDRRLIDDPELAPGLRQMLTAARDDGPSAGESAALLARLDGIAGTAGPAAAAGAGTATWLALLAGGALLVSAVIYGVIAISRASAPAAAPPPLTRAGPAPPVAARPPGPPEPGRTAPLPAPAGAAAPPVTGGRPPAVSAPAEPAPGRRADPSPPRRRSAPTAADDEATDEPAAPTELQLITRARDAMLAGSPRSALTSAERHGALYRRGLLAEEREAIAIEALFELGRRDRASARLAAFLRDFPRSGYRDRLRALESGDRGR